MADALKPQAAHPQIPPLARLALAYAPTAARPAWADLLELDGRIGAIVRGAREPVLAQIRLAWWRERLAEVADKRPRGEPLLARLGQWSDAGAGLIPLIDGWEALLDDPVALGADEAFVAGRVAAVAVLAREVEAGHDGAWAARAWGQADLALMRRETAVVGAPGPRLAPQLRPLAVLAGVTARAAGLGDPAALVSPGALLAALRHGLLRR